MPEEWAGHLLKEKDENDIKDEKERVVLGSDGFGPLAVRPDRFLC